eukprot:scaffold48_cov311-Pinguiococcus_pyrenoidosus.AAC.147
MQQPDADGVEHLKTSFKVRLLRTVMLGGRYSCAHGACGLCRSRSQRIGRDVLASSKSPRGRRRSRRRRRRRRRRTLKNHGGC